jgi:GTPase SAR1 family protein
MYRNPLSKVPHLKGSKDRKPDYPFKIKPPLLTSMSCLISGSPASGKTSLITSFLLSKDPVYYYKFFDEVFIISGSTQTMSLDDFGLPESHIFEEYSEEIMSEILSTLQEGENGNSLIWLDDVINDLSPADKVLNKAILNRRHITQNHNNKTKAELSIWISTQKYNRLALRYRTNITCFIIFPTSNHAEIRNIKDELLGDLTKEQQDAVLDICFSEPYSFLFINTLMPKGKRLYCKFDLLKLEEI